MSLNNSGENTLKLLLPLVLMLTLILPLSQTSILIVKVVDAKGNLITDYTLVLFKIKKRRIILISRVIEMQHFSLVLTKGEKYYIGVYLKRGATILTGWTEVVGGEKNNITLVVKPLYEIPKSNVSLTFPRAIKGKTKVHIFLIVPHLGVISVVNPRGNTVLLPRLPIVLGLKSNNAIYYTIYFPKDKCINATITTLSASTSEIGKVYSTLVSPKTKYTFTIKKINTQAALRVTLIVVISLLVAYFSYIIAKRKIEQRI